MYTTIQTVTGQFPIERLENILMHEHIVLGYAGWFYNPRCAELTTTRQKSRRSTGC